MTYTEINAEERGYIRKMIFKRNVMICLLTKMPFITPFHSIMHLSVRIILKVHLKFCSVCKKNYFCIKYNNINRKIQFRLWEQTKLLIVLHTAP